MLTCNILRFYLRFKSCLWIEVRFVSQLYVSDVFVVDLFVKCEVLVLAVNVLVILVDFVTIIWERRVVSQMQIVYIWKGVQSWCRDLFDWLPLHALFSWVRVAFGWKDVFRRTHAWGLQRHVAIRGKSSIWGGFNRSTFLVPALRLLWVLELSLLRKTIEESRPIYWTKLVNLGYW